MNLPRGVHAGGWALTAVAGALLGLVVRPELLTTVLGPSVEHWLWLSPTLAAMATFADDRPAVASVLSLAARLGVWVLAALWLADPAPNGPDALAMWARAAGATIRTAIAGLAGLLVIGAVIALFLSPSAPPRDDRRTTVTAGSSLGPTSAALLRLGLRTGLWLVATLVRLALLLIAWTALGGRGAVSVAQGAGDDRLGSILGQAFAAIGGGSSSLGRWLSSASSDWGKREKHGVWVIPAAVARDAVGEIIEDLDWSPGADETADETELREFASGLVAAYDVALSSGSRSGSGREPGQDPRSAPPKLVPYRIEVARAWTQPDYHAVVMRITPPTAATAAARLGTDALVPALDAATSLTSSDLRRLRLSDRRLAADPLRAGVAGLFVALDRAPESGVRSDAAGDPLTRAVTRALDEAGLDDRFRFTSHDDGFDADTLEYRASFRSSAEYRELEAAWKGLQPAIVLFSRNAAVRLEARLDPYAFVVVAPKPTPEFPSGEAVDLEHILARYEPVLRRRVLRFILGLDHRGEPLYVELGTETPHLLVAGGTGSGKSRAVFSALTQLVSVNAPDRLGLWLLDSVKRELTNLFGDAPHVERRVIAEDAADVVVTLTAFTTAMDARYRELGGREFDPSRGRSHLLVIEEWADLRDLLDRTELDEVVRLVNRIGQIGRGAGFHLVLVTQKASAEVIPPRLKSNFKGRIAGYFAQASDFAILFDQHKRLLPNVKGRLAVSLGGDEIRIVQAVYADNETIRRRIKALGGRSGPLERPSDPVPALPDEFTPRLPTVREVELMSPLTLARILFAWQAEEQVPIVVSVRTVAERLRSLGHTPGRTERLMAVLADLEAITLLERVGESANAPRRLRVTWPEARRLLGTNDGA